MNPIRRVSLPMGASLVGMVALAALYFGIVSWAESPEHAVDLFWQDRWIVIPILLGFGLQVALYAILKLRLFVPLATTGAGGPMTPAPAFGAGMGAGGATSTAAMVACCAHHVSDVLPILGLTAATAFLAEYRTTFMLIGLGVNLVGIGVMLAALVRERRRVLPLRATVAGVA